MNENNTSLIPAKFVCVKDERFCVEKRLWQSAPSAAITAKGRIFCVYSGDNNMAGETTNNYNVCAYSDNNGDDFQLAFYTYHEHGVRISETLLFMSPDGELYHFWTQNYGYFDGRGGIWCCVCKDPDASIPVFDEPRRICDGCMADNPVVMKDGRWIFPASRWTHIQNSFYPFPGFEGVSIWESLDKTNNLKYVGGFSDPSPSFSENSVFEDKNGDLHMVFRTVKPIGLKTCVSKDGGNSWSKPTPFAISGPDSRFMLQRLPTGALLLVTHYKNIGRSHLTALISDDDGKSFPYALLLDERTRVSYPSGNITEDGHIILAYDRDRKGEREILLAYFTEDDVRNGSLGQGSYTKKIVAKGGTSKGI